MNKREAVLIILCVVCIALSVFNTKTYIKIGNESTMKGIAKGVNDYTNKCPGKEVVLKQSGEYYFGLICKSYQNATSSVGAFWIYVGSNYATDLLPFW